MKKIKYILIFILSLGIFNSCLVDDTADIDKNDQGLNLAVFNTVKGDLTVLADNAEHTLKVKILVTGPTVADLTSDISVTFAASSSSTAVSGVHYRIDNPTVTLTKANNYLGNLEIVILTAGNAPLEDDDPGYADWVENYVAPKLYVDVISTTGDSKVGPSGKSADLNINFVSYCFFAGEYDVEMRYFHPTAGGSYPNDPYGGVRVSRKTMNPLSSKECKFGFAIWTDNNSWLVMDPATYAFVSYTVADTWNYNVVVGDPNDPSKVSHYDPITRKIYLYYHYSGSGGNRIFWEVFTPRF